MSTPLMIQQFVQPKHLAETVTGCAPHDEVLPEGRWQFDGDVTEVFEDMLRRSIPQYDVMRQAVFEIGCPHVQHGTHVVDLGASRGDALAPFLDRFGAYCSYVAVEVSKPMLEVLRVRFAGWIDCGKMRVLATDLCEDYPPVNASLTLSVLTLMFTPMEHRLAILQSVHDHLVDGGALVMVEKVLGSSARLNALMVELYHEMKRRNGYTDEQIRRKAMSLRGVLVPVTADWCRELLRMVGFREVDCFWRWMNFAGWLAVKG